MPISSLLFPAKIRRRARMKLDLAMTNPVPAGP